MVCTRFEEGVEGLTGEERSRARETKGSLNSTIWLVRCEDRGVRVRYEWVCVVETGRKGGRNRRKWSLETKCLDYL